MVNWNFREEIWPQLDDGGSGLPPSDYYDVMVVVEATSQVD